MRTPWLGTIAMLLFMLAGCSNSGVVIGGKVNSHPVHKIISLSPSTTEIVAEIGAAPYLKGRTSSCDFPVSGDIKNAIVVVAGTKPDFEKIISIKPDLIVYDAKLYSKTDMTVLNSLKQGGTDIEPMDVDTVQGLIDYIEKVSGNAEMAMFGSKTGDQIYAAVQNAKAAAPPKPVRVAILTGGSNSFFVAGKSSFLGDVVKICGGEPVGPEGNIFGPMTVEAMIQANPEIILTSEDGKDLVSDPRFASMSAIQAKPRPRVYHVDPGVLLRSGPRVKTLIESLSNLIGQASRAAGGQG